MKKQPPITGWLGIAVKLMREFGKDFVVLCAIIIAISYAAWKSMERTNKLTDNLIELTSGTIQSVNQSVDAQRTLNASVNRISDEARQAHAPFVGPMPREEIRKPAR